MLPYHCLDVAAVGRSLLSGTPGLRQKFAAIIGLEEATCSRWLVLLLALHDIGKFSESFQKLRPDLLEKFQGIISSKTYTSRHDNLGYLFLKTSLDKEEIHFPPGVSFDEWQDVVMAMVRPFTGGIMVCRPRCNGLPLRAAHFFSENDDKAARQFAGAICTLICGVEGEFYHPSPFDLEEQMKMAFWLMAGFVVLV